MIDLQDDWAIESDLRPEERVPDDLPFESDDPEDVALIYWLLSYSPGERLAIAQSWAQGALALRDAKISR